jgi:hypothetical protein
MAPSNRQSMRRPAAAVPQTSNRKRPSSSVAVSQTPASGRRQVAASQTLVRAVEAAKEVALPEKSPKVRTAEPLEDPAAKRLRVFGPNYVPLAASQNQMSLCETIKVLPGVDNDYLKRLSDLEAWRKQENLPAPKLGSDVCRILLDYFDALLVDNFSHADASKIWAAVQRHVPSIRAFPVMVRRVQNALDGFVKRAPAQERCPPPEEIPYAVIGALLWLDLPLEAANELLRFKSYSRPTEIDTLLVSQIIPPREGSRHWSLLFAPTASGHPSKSGEFEEGVTFDIESDLPLFPVLAQLTQGRQPDELVFVLPQTHFIKAFGKAMDLLQLSHLNINRHAWRHAAASADLEAGRRSRLAVKEMGRWKSDYSLRRYAKVAKMQQYANQFPPEVVKFGRSVMTQLPLLLAGEKLRPPFT